MKARRPAVTFLLVAAITVLTSFTQAQDVRSALSEPVRPKVNLQPLFVQIIEGLRSNDAVIPQSPDVHPVTAVYSREAIIPPQCYTKTEGKFNPCYVCHQNQLPDRENKMNDAGLQAAYSFSEPGLTNSWKNLFEDRSKRVAKISDREILRWIDQDNYSALSGRLKKANFTGWIPDLKNLQEGASAFDAQGFAKDGSHWVAFNYKPMPSTFWPTNGSTDDVMIRLDKAFRTLASGEYSRDVYQANLAILEANIKGLAKMSTPVIDEQVIGVDLNQDGKLQEVTEINKLDRYVGAAHNHYLDTHLYPAGTEFLHTVRYLGIGEQDEIGLSRRMKEVRYMKKWVVFAKPELARKYYLEELEKEAGHLPGYYNLQHRGLDNSMGWSVQGFMEDYKGRLRVNTFEENMFCMGCHNSIGSTIDKTFSFARKVDGAKGWGYINLKGMPETPNLGEGPNAKGEIATYLERVGGGSEFRNNPEMVQRWFKADGTVDHAKIAQAKDVYELLAPSRERALMLNKAYRLIVKDQDFIFGRDASVVPPNNVYKHVDNKTSPTLPADRIYTWDIRLDWAKASPASEQKLLQK